MGINLNRKDFIIKHLQNFIYQKINDFDVGYPVYKRCMKF